MIKSILIVVAMMFVGCGGQLRTDIEFTSGDRTVKYYRSTLNENDQRKFHYEETKPDGTKIVVWGGATSEPNVEAIKAQNLAIFQTMDRLADLIEKLAIKPPLLTPKQEEK